MCDFDLHEPVGWTATVGAFTQQRSDDGRTVTLGGTCPRCSHDMSVELAVEDRTGRKVTATTNDESLGSQSFIKIAYCNCAAEHKDRPTERAGCGAYGALKIG